MRVNRLAWAFFLLVPLGGLLLPRSVFGCSCIASPPGITSAGQLVEWRARGADSIFEGTVADAHMKSSFIEAPVGGVVPANLDEGSPVILVTFSDVRFYKGAEPRIVQVETGLGGGDCGFQFEMGKSYLVYAYRDDHTGLTTGICTATALIGESAANLAYLRGEPIPPNHRDAPHARGAKLCGRVALDSKPGKDEEARIMFLRNGSTSPVPYYEVDPDEKGRFCADLDPGEYRLLFTSTSGQDSVTSFSYYPGTSQLSDAAEIALSPGQSISDLEFEIPTQDGFSIAGMVSTSDHSRPPLDVKVILIGADQPFQSATYAIDVAPDGTFKFPRVLSGRYWILLDIDSDSTASKTPKWSTIKTEIIVNGNNDHVALELIRN